MFLNMMNFKNFLNKSVVQCEAAEPWQLGFQDPATPIMEGIVNLHHDIMFIIVVIGVFCRLPNGSFCSAIP